MNFNLLILAVLFFVFLPELFKKQIRGFQVSKKLQKWFNLTVLLNLFFNKVPKFEYNAHFSIVLGLIFVYFSLNTEGVVSLFSYASSLLFFVYLAHLYSNELFDTSWNTLLTFFSFYIFYSLISTTINYFLIETDWTMIFKNRRLLLLGPYFINPETGNQVWRFWPPFYAILLIVCSGYGTLGEKKYKFLIPYGIFSSIAIWALVYDTDYYSNKFSDEISNRGYDATESLFRLLGGLMIGLVSYLVTHTYCSKLEEYQINYWQTVLIYFSFFGFIGTLLILNPPGESGVRPSAWGGFVLNLIFAFGSLFIGFGIGIVLVFGRRSPLPVFYIPCVTVIELVRAGPLVAWLFFAQFLFPDLMNPIWEADIASRIILVFAFFFGCYLAEILRGGLQSVSHGQYEAATALGLSPVQIKLQIELPQAIRITLPAIVSQMIAMFKDTSLVYYFGIIDAFKIAQDIPSQRDFIGQDFDALIFVGMMFWILSFYLSQISRRVEKGLGLVKEGGGELT